MSSDKAPSFHRPYCRLNLAVTFSEPQSRQEQNTEVDGFAHSRTGFSIVKKAML